jgi:hypothetical protein
MNIYPTRQERYYHELKELNKTKTKRHRYPDELNEMERYDLIEVTVIGDDYRTFLNPSSGIKTTKPFTYDFIKEHQQRHPQHHMNESEEDISNYLIEQGMDIEFFKEHEFSL